MEIFVFTLTWQDNIGKNYHSIRLKPDQFSSYLTTEVGFTSFEHLGAPKCSIRGNSLPCQNKNSRVTLFITVTWHHLFIYFLIPKGFQRPIYLFHKWPLLPWRSLNVSCPKYHHTYEQAGCTGLQGIIRILYSYPSYSTALKVKFRMENGTKSSKSCGEEAPIRILWDYKLWRELT